MSSIQELDTTQLATARTTAWHQDGEPVLTLEAARTWIGEHGLVLFAPRAQQLPTPAPSLVEATLGVANDAPTAAETGTAKNLVSRLVADGAAVPLNLLGVPGDVPDFVVSSQVFSYIFTLRGDKAWKQPPTTSGAISVSPLGLHIYEVLTAAESGRGAMTAAELANELGREVTETAILRGLGELWGQLRVLPLINQGEGATLWELTTRRFTKAIKAGANAGQPTALSTLISLYLGQVYAATEEEIATFLSPLTARSRVREVLRTLTSARQLETVAVEGKTLLHVPGGLPAFVAQTVEGVEGEAAAEEAPLPKPKKIGTGRISSFAGEKTEKSSFRGKPTKSFGGARPTTRAGESKPDRERRPFQREGKPGAAKSGFAKEKPSYSKPWDEESKPRAAAKAEAPKKDGFTKFRKPAPEDREPLGPREQAGLPEEKRTAPRKATKSFERRPFEGKPADRKPYAKKTFGDKPAFGAKRPYTPRGEEGGERPAFKPRSYEKRDGDRPFARKAAGDRPYAKKTFGDKPSFGSKPAFGAKRPYTPRTEEGGERPAFKPRSYEKRDGDKPFARKAAGDRPYAKKTFGDKPSFGAKRPYAPRTEEGGERAAFKPRTFERKSFGDKPAFGGKPSFGAKRPYASKSEGDRSFVKRAPKPRFEAAEVHDGAPVERSIPKRPFKARGADYGSRPFNKDPWVAPTESSEGKRPYKARTAGGFGGAKKSFGGKKPFGAKKPFGSKPGGAKGFTSRKKPEA